MSLIWINHAQIYNLRDGEALSRLFVGDNKTIQRSVNFYCDRTREVLPNHLRLPEHCSNLSWKDITFLRTKDLENLLKNNHNQCMVQWSGGIDSTYILSSIIENMDPSLFDRIVIGLSAASLWENPYFYRDQILTRFSKIQDIEHSKIDPEIIVVNGNLGDKIQCPEITLKWLVGHSGPQSHITRKLDVIKYLSRYNDSLSRAEKLYDSAIESANRANVSIETVADLLWWIGFNFAYVGMYYMDWGRPWTNHVTLGDIENNKFYWFRDEKFQCWAMSQTGRFPYVDTNWHQYYKQEAKKIIYQLDKNQYYFAFKQKISSTTPLEMTWEKIGKDQPWILAIDSLGNKHYTDRSRLDIDLNQLGIKI